MSDDFDAIFAEASAEVEANPDLGSDLVDAIPQAKVHMGDGEVIGSQDETDGESESTNPDDTVTDPDDLEVSDGNEPDDTDTPPAGFDWKEHKDSEIELPDGTKVPLGEAVNGYLRQSDYTKKTQELAGQRKMVDAANQLRDALDNDPAGTLAILAAHYGVEFGESPGEDDPYETDDPELKPLLQAQKEQARRLQETEARLARQDQETQARQILAEVKAEVAAVQSEFEDFDPQVILPIAMEKGLTVRDAYLLKVSDDAIKERQANKVKAEQVRIAAEDAAKKRKTSATTSSNASLKADGTARPVKSFDSFEDMLKNELGMES